MKTMQVFMVALLFSTMLFFEHVPMSFADEHSKVDIQTLKDSAATLKSINPGLSDRLSKYADEEANEKEETKDEMEEHEGGNIKLLNDSATALQSSNPQLADGLKKYAHKESQEEKVEKK